MQDMLKKIIEMDKEARQIKAQAEEKKIVSEHEIDELKKSIHDDYIERAKERIEKNVSKVQERSDKELNEFSESFETSKKELENYYSENKDRWIEEIVSNVTAL